MSTAGMLVIALIFDAIFGEPERLWSRWPHPAVLMGRLIGWGDDRFNGGNNRHASGILFTAALCLIGWLLGSVIAWFGWLPQVLLAAILLAQNSLVAHVRAVAQALRRSLPEGRTAVARIVGRDTAGMDAPAVARAAIESGAENASDGVVAPAFWFLIAGLPGLLVYKLVNTADSMIGYRTPRHEQFGWASARLDDLLNLIPARLTAFALAALSGHLRDWPAITADARLHRSPNAGWPEAAMARALNVALSGPRSYDRKMQVFPFVHPDGSRTPGPRDIDAACTRLWQLWAVLLGASLLLTFF